MKRLTGLTHDQINHLRDVYRTTSSASKVIRHWASQDPKFEVAHPDLLMMDLFCLRVRNTHHLIWWWPQGQSEYSDEELDEKMRVEIESTRHLWDKPASSE